MSDRLSRLTEHTEENAHALRARIAYLTRHEGWSYQYILDNAHSRDGSTLSGIDKSRLSRFVNFDANWNSLGSRNHSVLVTYIYERGLWQKRAFAKEIKHIDDHLYHSLVNFFDIKIGTEDNVAERASGRYFLYRPALITPDKYVIALMEIWHDTDTHANRITLTEHHSGFDNSRPKHYNYSGYLLRKSKKYFAVMSDQPNTGLYVLGLPDTFREDYAITSLSGVLFGMFGGRPFTSRIYAERLTSSFEGDPLSLIDIYNRDQVPETVLASLHEWDSSSVVSY